MDGNTPTTEVERWLGISIRLLNARDFVAAKTFAVRVRESDPNNVMSEQIIAVVETVLAGEKRVNSAQHPDWYSVLQLPRLVRDPDLIINHYRRLMNLLHPERNRVPFADYAFQLVRDAWSILSDSNKKLLFDSELSVYLQGVVDQAGASAAAAAGAGSAVGVGNGINNPQQVVNTFPFLQQQQQTPLPQPLWVQQQQQQLQEHQQLHQHGFYYNGNNHNNSINQMQQIEFMQQQSPQQLLPQWQMRDPNPGKVGERNRGLVNTPIIMTEPPGPVLEQPQPSVVVPPRVVETFTRMNNVVDGGNVGVLHVDGNVVVEDNNVASVNGNEDGNVVVEKDGRKMGDGIESFWTACPYCLYVFEYEEVFRDYTLKCQNCRKGFQAVQIPSPPPFSSPSGENDGEKGNKVLFHCWGFVPLGISNVPYWAPFTRMVENTMGNGGGNFELFENGAAAAVGPKKRGRPRLSKPNIHVVDDDGNFNSDPSEESSDQDWRRKPDVEKKKKKIKKPKTKTGRGRGRPRKKVNPQAVDVKDEEIITSVAEKGKKIAADDKDVGGGSNMQNDAPGSIAGAMQDSAKKVGATLTRNQARRRVKNMGSLDLNVEFNNEGDEHAPATSAVNVGEAGVENIEFFEGLDEFLSTLPILNGSENDKAKSS